LAGMLMPCEFGGRHTYRFTPATSIPMMVDCLPMKEYGDLVGGQGGL